MITAQSKSDIDKGAMFYCLIWNPLVGQSHLNKWYRACCTCQTKITDPRQLLVVLFQSMCRATVKKEWTKRFSR